MNLFPVQQCEGLHTEILEVALRVRILDPEDTKLHSIKTSKKNVCLGSLGYNEYHRKGHRSLSIYNVCNKKDCSGLSHLRV